MADYPSWELPYWQIWDAREPTDGQRLEHLLTNVSLIWINGHREKGKKRLTAKDVIHPDLWEQARQQDEAESIRQMFAVGGIPVIRKEPEPDDEGLL